MSAAGEELIANATSSSSCERCSRTVVDHCRYGWNCIGVSRAPVLFAYVHLEPKPLEIPRTRLFEIDGTKEK